MRKSIKFLLASSFFLSTSIHASANDQRLDGRDEGFIPEAEIEVNARLGEFDNSVPGPYPPIGDMRWINVALPTTVLFQSDDLSGGNVEDLVSAGYEIRNYSHMGIAISLKEFTIVMNPTSMDYIGELFLIGYNGITTNRLPLINYDGLAAENDLFLSMRGNLGYEVVTNAVGKEEIKVDPSLAIFEFKGGLEKVPEVGVAQPTFEMIFTIESIERYPKNAAGNYFEGIHFADISEWSSLRSLSSLQHSFLNSQHINSELEAKLEVASILRHESSIEPPTVIPDPVIPDSGGNDNNDVPESGISTTPENPSLPEAGAVMTTGITLLASAILVVLGLTIAAQKRKSDK